MAAMNTTAAMLPVPYIEGPAALLLLEVSVSVLLVLVSLLELCTDEEPEEPDDDWALTAKAKTRAEF
ncbi:hypothetical protein GGF41_004175 [Coemansia sp. RSA 2531]|nr:hypothetical protein GGF41_004175 [Coemansia sp. RSA 2531]